MYLYYLNKVTHSFFFRMKQLSSRIVFMWKSKTLRLFLTLWCLRVYLINILHIYWVSSPCWNKHYHSQTIHTSHQKVYFNEFVRNSFCGSDKFRHHTKQCTDILEPVPKCVTVSKCPICPNIHVPKCFSAKRSPCQNIQAPK